MSEEVDAFEFHRSLLANKTRTEAFRQAIQRCVRPGDVVADVGTGSGILAFFACHAGASKVYAIEPNAVIEVARQVCNANGLQDRIVFIRELSSRTVLPERIDVLVSDPDQAMFTSIIDARRRWLKDGGRIIPQSVVYTVVPVESPVNYQRVDFWSSRLYDLDFSPFRRFVVNNPHALRSDQCSLLGAPVAVARITLAEAETADLRGNASFVVEKAGVLHGISGWFTTEIMADKGQAGAQPILRPDWARTFFPLETAVPVVVGDVVSVFLQTSLVGNSYVWSWDTEVHNRSGQRKAAFKQSTFAASPQSPALLRRLAASHKPALSESGAMDRFILGLMNGDATLEEIARQTAEHFPGRFLQWRAALRRVSEVSERYSR